MSTKLTRSIGGLLAITLVGLLVLPLLALLVSSSWSDVRDGIAHPSFAPALLLSLRTTSISMVLVVLLGTPLAWWLASSSTRVSRVVAVLIDLPIIVPPAVVGVALLQAFGLQGLFGPSLESLGIRLPFSEAAVVLAQLVVAAPFYVQAAANAFARLEPDVLLVARSLGASRFATFVQVVLPLARPGLIAGISLAWARALGEFGATLLFAGNMPGRTQTLSLAIFSALEVDVRLAVVFSLALVAAGGVLLIALRIVPRWVSRTRDS